MNGKYLVEIVFPGKERFSCELVGYKPVPTGEVDPKSGEALFGLEEIAIESRNDAIELITSSIQYNSGIIVARDSSGNDFVLSVSNPNYIRLPRE
jgi:hypothetical protein